MLVERDEVAYDPVVELERALVLGQGLGIGVEARDDVIPVLARADRVGPMIMIATERSALARIESDTLAFSW